MARTTFISYKYNEAQETRDRIIQALGNGAQYYRGEDGFSNDLTSYKATTIKEHLKEMIYGTSVTIVILSPNINLSQWIPWEIEYSLGEYTRNGRTSHTNGVVCVLQKQKTYWGSNSDGYEWFRDLYGNWDFTNILPIIKHNQNNKKNWSQSPIPLNSKLFYDALSLNYIDIVKEETLYYEAE